MLSIPAHITIQTMSLLNILMDNDQVDAALKKGEQLVENIADLAKTKPGVNDAANSIIISHVNQAFEELEDLYNRNK